jgi:hypothetical protein
VALKAKVMCTAMVCVSCMVRTEDFLFGQHCDTAWYGVIQTLILVPFAAAIIQPDFEERLWI